MHDIEIQSGRFLSHLFAYKISKDDLDSLSAYCLEKNICLERELAMPKRFFNLLNGIDGQAELLHDVQSVWYHLDFVINCFIDQQGKKMLDLSEVQIKEPDFVQEVFDESQWCMLNCGYIAKGCLVHSFQIEQEFDPLKLSLELFCPRAYEKLFMLGKMYYGTDEIDNMDIVQVPKDYHDIHVEYQGAVYALGKRYTWQKIC